MSKKKKSTVARDCLGPCDDVAPVDRDICAACLALVPADLQDRLAATQRPGQPVNVPDRMKALNDIRAWFWRRRSGAPAFDVLAPAINGAVRRG